MFCFTSVAFANPVKEARVSEQTLTEGFLREVCGAGDRPRAVTCGYLAGLGLCGGGVSRDAVPNERLVGLDRHISIFHPSDTARSR